MPSMNGTVYSNGERAHPSSKSEQGAAPQDRVAAARAASRRIAATIGDVVAVLSRSPEYQNYTLADLHWMVFPAVISGQCAVAYSKNVTYGVDTPVAVVCWAMMPQPYAIMPMTDLRKLKATDWTSGIHPTLVIKAGRLDLIDAIAKTSNITNKQ